MDQKTGTLHHLGLPYHVDSYFKNTNGHVETFASLSRQTIITIPRIQAITNAIPDRTGKPAFTLSMNDSFSSMGVQFNVAVNFILQN